ncbi:MAG: isocitrate lyase/phosphoenolpyruvate mutase family protein [Salinarimonas sp.]|nr:isocitrate lyase/phosphoenolpyruvate mutase family protein [Salinarimonas sp.]
MGDEKIVYVGMVGDMLHAGHIDILAKARELGRVVVGVLSDEAAATCMRVPFMRFADRVRVIENIAGVSKVVPQYALSYRENLMAIRPDYVVHGEHWRNDDKHPSVSSDILETLAAWGGELVELPGTTGVSSTLIHQALEEEGVLARIRQARLRRMLEIKPFIRVIEAHSGLAAVIAHRVSHEDRRFDALWQSSLTDATLRAKPDLEIVDSSARIATVNEIFEATPLPLIYDGDTGGFPERVYQLARSLDRAGVSALCLEDKAGSKRNSLYGTEAGQEQVSIEAFCERIRAAKRAARCGDMMFISRIESFILGAGMTDALERAEAYIEAGSDAILIHSIARTADEVIGFARELRHNGVHTPIFVVPTTYGGTHESALADAGINAIIYANHLLRAAYPRMVDVARHILAEGCSDDAWMRSCLASTKDVLSLIPAAK